MKKRKSMKMFWVRKFYQKNEKEREILETLLWNFTCFLQYNYSFSLHNPILLPANMKDYFLW